jgi:Domain of unknown function (DUF1992)
VRESVSRMNSSPEPVRGGGEARDPSCMRRAPLTYENAVEKQIREAQERGDFDNLPGAGKPLNFDSWGGGEWSMAFHVLKQAGETLPWISLGQDIDAQRAKLDRLLNDARPLRGGERARARDRYLREAAVLDKLLEEYAFQVPTRTLDRGRLPPHVAARQFDDATS